MKENIGRDRSPSKLIFGAAVGLCMAACSAERTSFDPGAESGQDAATEQAERPEQEAGAQQGASEDSGSRDEPATSDEQDEDTAAPKDAGGATREEDDDDGQPDASVPTDNSETQETTSDESDETSAPTDTDTPDASDAVDAECARDADCEDGVCVDDACVACDPESHRGCADDSDTNLCKAGEEPDSNTCVACLEEEETRAGTTACGLNDRGAFDEICEDGQWSDTAECSDPDECEDSEARAGETACGDGVLGQSCVEGAWVNTAVCIECDPEVDTYRCYSGDSQLCQADGSWAIDETCTGDTPACVEATGQCGTCTEDEATCIDETTRGVCNASGAFVESGCEFACVQGECTGVCVPEAKQCRSLFVPDVCDDEGQWERQADCTGDQACDEDTGECISPPVIVSFASATAGINPGDSATLNWNVTGADEIEISSLGVVTGTSTNVSPAQATTYTLTASNEAGEVTANVTVHLVSEGTVSALRHFGSALGEAIQGLVVEEANNRIVTLFVLDDTSTFPIYSPHKFYLGEHSLTDGALQDTTETTIGWGYASSFVATPTGYVMTAHFPSTAEPSLLTINEDLEVVDDYSWTYNMAFYEFATDAVQAPNGDYFAVGVDGPSGTGFIARISEELDSVEDETLGFDMRAIAIDASSRVFVGGRGGILNRYSTGNIASPSKTATLDKGADANENASDDDDVNDLVIDGAGNVIAVGNGASGGFVVKFGPDLGTRTWRVDLTGNADFEPEAVAVDALGNVFVAGTVETASQETDVVVRAYDADGEPLWGPIQRGSTDGDFASAIAVDSRGTVFVVGQANASMSGSTGYQSGVDGFMLVIK